MALAVLFGVAVGFALGMTGGVAMPPRQAVGVSLAAVGATALVGAVQRLRRREVELGTRLLFAVAGMVGAPVGSFMGRERLCEHCMVVDVRPKPACSAAHVPGPGKCCAAAASSCRLRGGRLDGSP